MRAYRTIPATDRLTSLCNWKQIIRLFDTTHVGFGWGKHNKATHKVTRTSSLQPSHWTSTHNVTTWTLQPSQASSPRNTPKSSSNEPTVLTFESSCSFAFKILSWVSGWVIWLERLAEPPPPRLAARGSWWNPLWWANVVAFGTSPGQHFVKLSNWAPFFLAWKVVHQWRINKTTIWVDSYYSICSSIIIFRKPELVGHFGGRSPDRKSVV